MTPVEMLKRLRKLCKNLVEMLRKNLQVSDAMITLPIAEGTLRA